MNDFKFMKDDSEIKIYRIEGAVCPRDFKLSFKGKTPELVDPKMNKKYSIALEIGVTCFVSKDGEDFYPAEAILLNGRTISVNDELKAKAMARIGS